MHQLDGNPAQMTFCDQLQALAELRITSDVIAGSYL